MKETAPQEEQQGDAPETVEQVEGFLRRARIAIAKKFLTFLAEDRTFRAGLKSAFSENFSGYGKSEHRRYYFLKRLKHSLSEFSDHSDDPKAILEDYQKKAEKEHRSIRLSVLKAYVALQAARKYAQTPEEREKLKQLFEQQREIHKLLKKPGLADHLSAFRDYVERDLEIQKRGRRTGDTFELSQDIKDYIAERKDDPDTVAGLIELAREVHNE